jgi:transcriptional regulator with XRE-family HTH domain
MKNPFVEIRENAGMPVETFAKKLNITPDYLMQLERGGAKKLPAHFLRDLRDAGYNHREINRQYDNFRNAEATKILMEVHSNGNQL